MEPNTDGQRLLLRLQAADDIESFLALYHEAASLVNELETVKKTALALAEQALRETGEVKYKHPLAGWTAGWTQPKTPKLDKEAWASALKADAELRAAQLAFDQAELALKAAQTPYQYLPEPSFYIR